MPFDVQGARQAGYSYDEILNKLAQDNNFDLEGAKAAGYKPHEILAKLAGPQEPPKSDSVIHGATEAAKGIVTGMGQMSREILKRGPVEAPAIMLGGNWEAAKRAAESFGEGDIAGMARHALAASVPMIGPMAEQAGDLAQEGRYHETLGNTLTNAATIALPEVPKMARAAARGLGGGLEAAGKQGVRSSLGRVNQRTAATPADIDRGVNAILKNEAPTSESGLQVMKDAVNATEAQKSAIVDTAPGRSISPAAGAVAGRKMTERLATQAAPTADVAAVERVVNDFYRSDRPGGVIARPGKAARNLTAREAQDIKAGTYERLGERAYMPETKNSASVLTEKQIAHELNASLTEAFPELGPLNKQQGGEIIGRKMIRDALDRGKRSGHRTGMLGAAVGGAVGYLEHGAVGSAIGALTGGGVGEVLSAIVRDPGIRSQVALKLYRAGKGIRSLGEAKSIVDARIEALANETRKDPNVNAPRYDPDTPELGLAIRHVNTGVDLPTTRQHFENAAGMIILDLKPKNQTEFHALAKREMGPNAFLIEDARGAKRLTLTEAYKAAKKGAARVLRESTKTITRKNPDGTVETITGQGLSSYEDYMKLADSPEGRATLGWYKSVGDLVKKHKWAPEDVDALLRWENAYSSNRAVDEAMALAIKAIKQERAGLIDDIKDTIPLEAKQVTLEGGVQRGPKLGEYYDTKKAEVGGPQPNWAVADGRMHEAAGFLGEAFTKTSRQAIDMRNRFEARRLGLKIQEAQEMTWGGHQALNKGNRGANVSFADRAVKEIEAQGGYDAVFRPKRADDFAFGANLPDKITLGHHTMAEAARDMERNSGFTVHPRGGESPKGGYIYSIDKSYERVHPRAISAKDISDYVKTHNDALTPENRYLGGWKDGDNRYLDVSEHEMDLATALRKAKAANQKAIWDNTNFVSIPMEGTASVVTLNDGRTLISDFVPTSNPKGLMTHVQLLKKHGVSLDDVKKGLDIENTGWIVDGELQHGGGGTVGKGVQVGAPENPNYVPYKDRKKAEE